MKYVVNEFKIHNNIGFIVSTYNENNVLTNRREVVLMQKTIKYKDKQYILLFDENGCLDEKHYDYINRLNVLKAYGTRIQMSNAIVILRKYSKILNKKVEDFTVDDYQRFYDFMTGNSNSKSFEFHTSYKKSTESSKKVINYCNSFLKVENICNSDLLRKIEFNRYSKSPSYINSHNRDCPKFISQKDMIQIHNYVINDNSLNNETRLKYDVIFRLMYVAGLRIGEVLGLTLEDFERKVNSETGEYYYLVYIRNRLSDNKNQSAKRCMKITNKSNYRNKDYYKKNVGYQTVLIKESLYEDIIAYFDLMSQRLKIKGKEPAKADITSLNGKHNYYIFNNMNNNTPLNSEILSEYTRNVFKKIGLYIDNKSRTNNLLHRFRHGFIMKLLYVDKLPSSEVIIYSRHSNEMCLQPYNNPTDEELSRILTDITEGVEYGITKNQTESFK